jgi:dihydrofolate reductase
LFWQPRPSGIHSADAISEPALGCVDVSLRAIDHGSPSTSMAVLIAHPDLAADENLKSPWSITTEPIAQAQLPIEERAMSLTRIHNLSISLDGFATGEPQSADAPFGHAGERLHEWMFGTRFWDAGGAAGVDDAFAERHSYGIGAEIMGANKFGPPGWQDDPDWKGWWGPNPPFHTPTFVLTHTPRSSIEMEGGTTFHFLDAAPAEALETAREAADRQDVRIGGGPTVVRDFVAAGLVDHMHLVQVPIVLGRGVRIWDGLEALEDAYDVEAVSSPSGVTHLTFARKVVS